MDDHRTPAAPGPPNSTSGLAATSPPPLKPSRNADYPSIPEDRLDNGLRILVVSDYRLPRIAIQMAWPVGRVLDSSDNLSLLSLAIDLIDKGTKGRSAREIAQELDRFAVQFDTETLMEFTFVEVAVLQEHLERAIELLAEMVIAPVFPGDELEKLQKRLSSSLVAQRSQPAFLARERLHAALFPNHPYQRISLPLEDVRRSDPETVRAAYRSRFGPDGAFLLLAGPIDLEEARQLAERHFANWRNAVQLPPEIAVPIPLEARKVHLVHRPHSVQSRMLVGGLAPRRADPDFLAFRVANQILGGSGSARLFLNLRERRGYTYGAYSTLSSHRKAGVQTASADLRSDATFHSIEEVLAEIETMRVTPPLEEELSRAKAELIGGFARQLETPDSIGTLELMRRLHGLKEDHYRGLIARIAAVTAEQVVEVARRRFDPDRLVITIVGDRDQLEDGLVKFGPVEVYDSDGGRI